MRRALTVGTLFIAATARANEPPPSEVERAWERAIDDADKELAACRKLGDGPGVCGEVTVRYATGAGWTHTASKTLGAVGEKAATCIHDAIARRYYERAGVDGPVPAFVDGVEHTERIGTARTVLPPIEKLLPLWRLASDDLQARRRFGAMVRDYGYHLGYGACIKTDDQSLSAVEPAWLFSAGTPASLSPPWPERLQIWEAMWHGDRELVTLGSYGLCLVELDDPALREMTDDAVSCLDGDIKEILVDPRIEWPADVAFTQISAHGGPVCALSTAGEITCCGAPVPVPPAPNGPFTQIAVGGRFACALDAKGDVACWGAIAAPPAGPFRTISAEFQSVCGIRQTGGIACWGAGTATPPGGSFVALTTAGKCGLRKGGRVECWGTSKKDPPGTFTQIDGNCGVRRDGTIACWRGTDIATPLPGTFVEVSVGSQICGRHRDGTLTCAPRSKAFDMPELRPPPSPPFGHFLQLERDCAITDDHHVSCWGNP
jgi:hypothetical protein